LLSVITPCRDTAQTLTGNLHSVAHVAALLESSGHQLEHLIVDGNSQDGTSKLVMAHCQRYQWCFWRPGYGGGPYAAMNAGLAMARGYYVHILNADDLIINPDLYVSALISAYVQNISYILASISYVQRGQAKPLSCWNVSSLPSEFKSWHLQLKAGLHYPHPGFVAERQRYASQGFDLSYRYAADYKAMQALLLSAHLNDVLLIHEPLVAMARGGITSSWRARWAGAQELWAINRELGIQAPLWRRYLGKIIQRFKVPL